MEYREIELSFDKRVATVCFNREASLNSFSRELKEECIDAFNSLADTFCGSWIQIIKQVAIFSPPNERV